MKKDLKIINLPIFKQDESISKENNMILKGKYFQLSGYELKKDLKLYLKTKEIILAIWKVKK